MLPSDIVKALPTFIIRIESLPDGLEGDYNSETKVMRISSKALERDAFKKEVPDQGPLPGDPLDGTFIKNGDAHLRALVWHEMAHWLYMHAKCHPKLQKWRERLDAHWLQRTKGYPVELSEHGWHFLRDHWIAPYAGKLFSKSLLSIGLELPCVYFEQIAQGPEAVAKWMIDSHSRETFDIVASILAK